MMPEARFTIQHPVRFTALLWCAPTNFPVTDEPEPIAGVVEGEEFRLARDLEQQIDGFLRLSTGQWLPLTEGMGLDQDFVFPPAPEGALDSRYRLYPKHPSMIDRLDPFYAGTYMLR